MEEITEPKSGLDGGLKIYPPKWPQRKENLNNKLRRW